MTLMPAYGRDYKSKAQIEQDLLAEKDFIVADYGPDMGRYANLQQLSGSIQVRYQQNRKIAVFDVAKLRVKQAKLPYDPSYTTRTAVSE